MNEAIEQLLVLQKRDRSIAEWREEITGLELKRAQVKTTSADAEAAHAAAEQTAKELEVRKDPGRRALRSFAAFLSRSKASEHAPPQAVARHATLRGAAPVHPCTMPP